MTSSARKWWQSAAAGACARGVVCSLGLIFASGCSDEKPIDRDAVTVGLLLPFTGTDSATASNFERAVLFARDQVNEGGGVGGRKLRVVSADTHSDPERAEASAQHLIDEGAVLIIGPESTEVADHIRPLINEHDVVLLSPLVGAADDRQIACEDPWFRLAPSARILGEALAKRMIADGHMRAAILSSEGAYDVALANAFQSLLGSLGGEVAYRGTLQRGAQSYTANIKAALAEQVDAVLLSATPRSAALVVNELGVLTHDRPQWYLSPLLKTELLLQNVVPQVLEGAIGVTPRIYDLSEAFPLAFNERWAGDAPLEGAYFYYDAVALTALALEQTLRDHGELGADGLRAIILDVSASPGEGAGWNELPLYLQRLREGAPVYYTGLTGPMKIRPCGDRQVGASSPWEVTGGEIVLLGEN
ncbi:MAG TPA: ABC transporter substrate-binding protein [Polyangiaceae bacterium]|nr:ABC transporter substrate-binding protein [Polyangiaceae bacterium]